VNIGSGSPGDFSQSWVVLKAYAAKQVDEVPEKTPELTE
jgi:hypothetical protein